MYKFKVPNFKDFPYMCYMEHSWETDTRREYYVITSWLRENFGEGCVFVVTPTKRYIHYGGRGNTPHIFCFRDLEDFMMFRVRFYLPILDENYHA